MKPIIQLVFTILFAIGIQGLGVPLFNEKKHETFAKTTHEWVQIWKGVKSNGLQKFSVLSLEIWASNIEKAICKLRKKSDDPLFDTLKADNSYFVFVNVES